MKNVCLAALCAVATLASAGFAHAGVGPRVQLAVPAAQADSAGVQVVGAPAAAGYPRGAELISVRDMSAQAERSTWGDAPGSAKPVYSHVLGATSAPVDAPEAPLPGALWLFGSALLAFLGISARRRF